MHTFCGEYKRKYSYKPLSFLLSLNSLELCFAFYWPQDAFSLLGCCRSVDATYTVIVWWTSAAEAIFFLFVQNSSEVHANAAETLSAITRIAQSALASKLASPKYVSWNYVHVYRCFTSPLCFLMSFPVHGYMECIPQIVVVSFRFKKLEKI